MKNVKLFLYQNIITKEEMNDIGRTWWTKRMNQNGIRLSATGL